MSWTIHCNNCGRSAAVLVEGTGNPVPGLVADALPGWQLNREANYDLCPACVGPATVIDCKVGGMTAEGRSL
jgi:hypothetical protein